MSRSNYSDDCDEWDLIRWRGAVTSAIRGARGQAMLRELLTALDAMPEKKLIADELEASGQFCALGVLGQKRGIDMSGIDPYNNREVIAQTFGIAEALAAEIMYENDERPWHYSGDESPEQRWFRMRQWVASQIKEPAP